MEQSPINPIVSGFAPDPSVAVIDGTFFLATSSFHLFPGLPIYTSNDLVSWTNIGNAINRKGQIGLSNSRTRPIHVTDEGEPLLAAGGLCAPTIRHHKGTTYIVCTNVIHKKGESGQCYEKFVISLTDIWSNTWSDPVYFDFNGIDPDLFFEDDNRTYIYGSSYTTGPPWISRVAINCFEIDIQTGENFHRKRRSGKGLREGWYYLLTAEGRTDDGHNTTIARSKSIWGPFYETAYLSHTGHGDLFQDLEGNWWIVVLGVRKEGGICPMSRESFISPVQWPEGGWPNVPPIQSNPDMAVKGFPGSSKLIPSLRHLDFLHIRDTESEDYVVSQDGHSVSIRPRQAPLLDPMGPISFIGKRRRRLQGDSRVSLPKSSLETVGVLEAGLAYYKDEFRVVRVFWSLETSTIVFKLENKLRSLTQRVEIVSQPKRSVDFRISYTSQHVEFSFAEDGSKWILLSKVDAYALYGSGFVGPIIGVYATTERDASFVEFKGSQVE
ncbi:uncharacterized protein NECHADRAFT_98469 [Fusarium vanettenii 77-13-4]|uniref:Beta-xylosidase C-terminal Concanavalin A-like domain-containing protein n=1 Tax=Fusarium vanettenii (strain ATCC MYA-4622 / CBS 123669 / FGSC 9596 / NRRL 45880 / 77-13-4) TaxID=660122 RepID=C7ZRE6_FUSV7|nr:uncharacterized protein NECHADRAFT_98469 [Fusarium vanettenii 77-13-4]EEU33410.1 hypothetical protein NECHADRAFT_98469 [Fusarium vanettenii 77-13-4]